MPYRFKHDESLREGITRIVLDEIDDATAQLEGKTKSTRDEATHEARKSVKKIRAVLRLVSPGLNGVFKQENARLRDVGRELSQLRDAGALVQTLDTLKSRGKKHLAKPAADSIRRALLARKTHIEQEKNLPRLLPKLAKSLQTIRGELKSWPLDADGFGAIEEGFAKAYRRGRRALTEVRDDPRPDSFHELRKRVKDHWYHVRLLENVWEDFLQGYEKTLKQIEKLLGDDHNLVLLHDVIKESPQSYGSDSDIGRLFDSIQRLQRDLRDEALAAARLVYEERPRRLVTKVHNLWGIWKKTA